MEKTKDYIESNKDKFLNELVELLRIPSVSTDATYKNDVLRAADFIR
ncbi:MAG: acetylornithine deacetylase/succinyl-diaminopimelate desuccinylase-like protein, partial [Cryomorphaceae bacterium]